MVHHIYAVNSAGVSEIREEISGWHLKQPLTWFLAPVVILVLLVIASSLDKPHPTPPPHPPEKNVCCFGGKSRVSSFLLKKIVALNALMARVAEHAYSFCRCVLKL